MTKPSTQTTSNSWRTRIVILSIILIAFFFAMDANPSLYLYNALLSSKTFTGKRIWITGASSGIGAELAKQFCTKGAHVILSSRRIEKLLDVASQCNSSSYTILPFDMTSINQTESSINQVISEGGVDILILNAGQYSEMTILQTDASDMDEIMKLNFESPAKFAVDVMKRDQWQEKKKGHIVVTSSILGKLPSPLNGIYSASKHALQAFFTTLRAENSSWLRVDIVCPGAVDTDLGINAKKLSDKESFADTIPGKMNVSRCVQLMVSGMSGPAILFYEMWIATQPTLSLFYFGQYLPSLAFPWLDMVGPWMVESWELGKGFNLW